MQCPITQAPPWGGITQHTAAILTQENGTPLMTPGTYSAWIRYRVQLNLFHQFCRFASAWSFWICLLPSSSSFFFSTSYYCFAFSLSPWRLHTHFCSVTSLPLTFSVSWWKVAAIFMLITTSLDPTKHHPVLFFRSSQCLVHLQRLCIFHLLCVFIGALFLVFDILCNSFLVVWKTSKREK